MTVNKNGISATNMLDPPESIFPDFRSLSERVNGIPIALEIRHFSAEILRRRLPENPPRFGMPGAYYGPGGSQQNAVPDLKIADGGRAVSSNPGLGGFLGGQFVLLLFFFLFNRIF